MSFGVGLFFYYCCDCIQPGLETGIVIRLIEITIIKGFQRIDTEDEIKCLFVTSIGLPVKDSEI